MSPNPLVIRISLMGEHKFFMMKIELALWMASKSVCGTLATRSRRWDEYHRDLAIRADAQLRNAFSANARRRSDE
jgi:hypothetical protein